MNTIPSIADWQTDPAGALAASKALADKTAADGDSSSKAVAIGIAAQVVRAGAPIAGAAVGGPMGAVAAAGLVAIADSLDSQHKDALAALTPEQQALVSQMIQVAVAQAAKKA